MDPVVRYLGDTMVDGMVHVQRDATTSMICFGLDSKHSASCHVDCCSAQTAHLLVAISATEPAQPPCA